jgi:hypothetical protein
LTEWVLLNLDGCSTVAFVELVEFGWTDTSQLLSGENTEKRPGKIQRLQDVTTFVVTLSDELVFELVQELQVQQILWGKSFLTNHSLHGEHILSDSVVGILKRKDENDVVDGEVERKEHLPVDWRQSCDLFWSYPYR